MKIKVYDNGGKTADRYTVEIIHFNGDTDFFGMSDNATSPNGFNQYIGNDVYCNDKQIRLIDLNKYVLCAIIDRILQCCIEPDIDDEDYI